MAAQIPNFTLNSGHQMPQIGLGTWLANGDDVVRAVKCAIACGYRHIDTAFFYMNQREIGAALKEAIEAGSVERKDMFITSKIWNTFHSKTEALRNLSMILEELGVEYLDLCLIHWPMGYKERVELLPKTDDGTKILLSDVDYLETWSALEQAVNEGKIRSIGLSNFNSAQIQRVWENSQIKPAVLEVCQHFLRKFKIVKIFLQVEIHPYFQQEKLVKFSRDLGIRVTAYSSLGSSDANPFKKAEFPSIFQDPVISKIAKEHNKTNAQIAIRYQIQRGICVIPKSLNEQRIAQNLHIFDFALSDDQMRAMAELGKAGQRITHLTLSCHSPNYPWGEGKPEF